MVYDRLSRCLSRDAVHLFDLWVAGLRGWVENHGGRLPKRTASDAYEVSLAKSLSKLQQKYRHSELSDEQLDKLRDVPGMQARLARWERSKHGWKDSCWRLAAWVEAEGRLPKRRAKDAGESALAQWLNDVAKKFQLGGISEQQLAMLEEVPGMAARVTRWRGILGKPRSWEQRCMRLQAWAESNLDTLPDYKAAGLEERSLARWMRRAAKQRREGRLPEECAAQLRSCPGAARMLALCDAAAKAPFERRLEQLLVWMEEQGKDVQLPRYRHSNMDEDKDKEERSLATWINFLCAKYRTGTLPPERVEQLRQVPGMGAKLDTWERLLPPPTWDQRCAELEAWSDGHGCSPPQRSSNSTREDSLAKWLMGLRRTFRTGHLTCEQLARLRRIPPAAALLAEWERHSTSTSWEDRCSQLRDWTNRHAGLLPKEEVSDTEERALAQWIRLAGRSYQEATLTDVQVTQLLQVPGMAEMLARW